MLISLYQILQCVIVSKTPMFLKNFQKEYWIHTELICILQYIYILCIQTLTFGPSIHRPIVDSVRGGALVGGCHEVIQTQLHKQFISLGLCDVVHTGYGSTRPPSIQWKACKLQPNHIFIIQGLVFLEKLM